MAGLIPISTFISLLATFAEALYFWPVCSAFYGQPGSLACDILLWETRSVRHNTDVGLAYIDTRTHLFAARGMAYPAGASSTSWNPRTIQAQWNARIEIPIYRQNDMGRGCKLAVLPRTLPDGSLGFAANRYKDLAESADDVKRQCVNTGMGFGGWALINTESNIIVVLYQAGSPYDNYVTAQTAAGRELAADRNGFPFGDPNAINPQDPTNQANPSTQAAGGASSSNPPGTQRGSGLTCGQNCASVNLCTGPDGCRCIADPWQGVGSGYFTGTCKLPFFSSHRGLGEIGINSTSSIGSSGSIGSTSSASNTPGLGASDTSLACPCNCTYVSNSCCLSTLGIVHEATNLKLGALQPPNATTVCNTATGDFQESTQ
ncbi:hypothetical protein MMC12_004963 [Toensbergia leucococca]|nr:hypothetical protein [Toensbergia leucococca]